MVPSRCRAGLTSDRQPMPPCAREANGTNIAGKILDGYPACRHREQSEIRSHHLSRDRKLYRSLELGAVVVAGDRPEWSGPSFMLGVMLPDDLGHLRDLVVLGHGRDFLGQADPQP